VLLQQAVMLWDHTFDLNGNWIKYLIVYPIEAAMLPHFLTHDHTFMFTDKQLIVLRTEWVGIWLHHCVHISVWVSVPRLTKRMRWCGATFLSS
jgi:hypothetical protein